MNSTKTRDLLAQIALGEDSTRQFKVDVRNAESLALEMASFANTDGGAIFIGVTYRRNLLQKSIYVDSCRR